MWDRLILRDTDESDFALTVDMDRTNVTVDIDRTNVRSAAIEYILVDHLQCVCIASEVSTVTCWP